MSPLVDGDVPGDSEAASSAAVTHNTSYADLFDGELSDLESSELEGVEGSAHSSDEGKSDIDEGNSNGYVEDACGNRLWSVERVIKEENTPDGVMVCVLLCYWHIVNGTQPCRSG